MTDPIRSALTPAQWDEFKKEESFPLNEFLSFGTPSGLYWTGVPSHAVAALALYGQPLGFRHEDVDLLLHAASLIEGEWGDEVTERDLRNLADRIAALQPPREEQ